MHGSLFHETGHSMRQGPDGKNALPLELLLSLWNPKVRVSAEKRDEREGMYREAGQTSKAGQFLRLHHIVNIQLFMHFGVQLVFLLFLFCFVFGTVNC